MMLSGFFGGCTRLTLSRFLAVHSYSCLILLDSAEQRRPFNLLAADQV